MPTVAEASSAYTPQPLSPESTIFTLLATEIKANILSNLTFKEALKLSLVNKEFQAIYLANFQPAEYKDTKGNIIRKGEIYFYSSKKMCCKDGHMSLTTNVKTSNTIFFCICVINISNII
jgi:hypothetical protein